VNSLKIICLVACAVAVPIVSGANAQTTLIVNNASTSGDITDFVTGGSTPTTKAEIDFNGDFILAGTNIGFSGLEGSGVNLSPGSTTDLLYPGSTNHCWEQNLDNGTPECLTAAHGTWAAGDLLEVHSGPNSPDIADTGISATALNNTVCSQGQQSTITGGSTPMNMWSCTLPATLFTSPHSFSIYASWTSANSTSTTYTFKLASTTLITTPAQTTAGAYRWEGKIIVTGTNAETSDVRSLELPTSFIATSSAFTTPSETTGSASSIIINFTGNGQVITPEVFMVIAN
jgi:hypothetical protein